jgi:hypothetical protein
MLSIKSYIFNISITLCTLTICMFRYVLKYESKNLIALSTAIQDWLTQSSFIEPYVCLSNDQIDFTYSS